MLCFHQGRRQQHKGCSAPKYVTDNLTNNRYSSAWVFMARPFKISSLARTDHKQKKMQTRLMAVLAAVQKMRLEHLLQTQMVP